MIRSIKGKKILAATHNQGKLEEITALLEPLNVKVVSAKDLNLPEPDETEETFVGNARIKAHAGATSSGLPSLSDDSGIEIDALDGAPGVYTADWAATPAGRDFEIAMKKAHSLLDKKNVPFPRTGRFSCTLVLAWPNGEDLVFQGKIDGIIVWPMRGDQGHGYDPIFQPDGYQVTFGEMDRWEKNKISHRAKAFENLIEHFNK